MIIGLVFAVAYAFGCICFSVLFNVLSATSWWLLLVRLLFEIGIEGHKVVKYMQDQGSYILLYETYSYGHLILPFRRVSGVHWPHSYAC